MSGHAVVFVGAGNGEEFCVVLCENVFFYLSFLSSSACACHILVFTLDNE